MRWKDLRAQQRETFRQLFLKRELRGHLWTSWGLLQRLAPGLRRGGTAPTRTSKLAPPRLRRIANEIVDAVFLCKFLYPPSIGDNSPYRSLTRDRVF